MIKLLKSAFPEHEWKPSDFPFRTRNYWRSAANTKQFMKKAGKELHIKEKDYEGWYKITINDVRDRGGAGPLKAHNDSLVELLRIAFPSYNGILLALYERPTNFGNRKRIKELY